MNGNVKVTVLVFRRSCVLELFLPEQQSGAGTVCSFFKSGQSEVCIVVRTGRFVTGSYQLTMCPSSICHAADHVTLFLEDRQRVYICEP